MSAASSSPRSADVQVAPAFVRVAVPVPQLDLLTYAVPDGLPLPAVGARVLVPLGTRSVTGIVVELESAGAARARVAQGCRGSEADAFARIKPLTRVLDAEPFLPPDVVALALWTAEYYAAGRGETILAVLPPKTRGERADAHKTQRVAAITIQGQELIASTTARSREGTAAPDAIRAVEGAVTAPAAQPRDPTTKQREALDLLAGTPAGMLTSELASRGVSPDVISRLAARGLISVRRDRIERDPFATAAASAPVAPEDRALTAEQSAALSRLTALSRAGVFKVALVHGVTGSGKTELYLRLAADVRARGGGVLMLVPEIALTPMLASLFRQAFGDAVAVQHSGLSDGERHDQWQRIRRGEIDVVIGTRSAVFAPIANLGLAIVDEEHDASYKQDESPRYHGRDVAIVRAQRAGALVVLGSATPSMESYHNAATGRYERVVLERRVLDRPLAAVTIVNMREEFAESGSDVVVSRALKAALDDRLARGEQALVLLNRRGFATAIFCRQCAATLDCPNCSVSLVVHGEGTARRARCHYCNYSMRVPNACQLCAAPYLEQAGYGTERVEAEVRRLVPGARVARLDRDAIRRRGALTTLLDRFRAAEIDVLVGTQMIAKGHDFPRVTLVGVVSADVGLGMADFRASERTFQLLTQVAGRAGRGETPGEAIIQTLYPEHYSIQLACRQDYVGFFARELQFRKSMRYPPFVSIVNAVVHGKTFSRSIDDAADLVQRIRDADPARQLRVLGPAPAALARLRGEYRSQLLVKGTNRRAMREAVQAAIAARPDLAKRTIIDIDPLTVL